MKNILVNLILLVHSVITAAQTIQSCPSGAVEIAGANLFRIHDTSCYLFMTYDKQFYHNTLHKCQDHGGILATPKTEAENDFLLGVMQELKQDVPMWIGLQYNSTMGALIWLDGEAVTWDNLNDEARRNIENSDYCAALHPVDGKWHAQLCSKGDYYSSHMPFICQYPIPAEDLDLDALGDKDGDDIDQSDQCPPFDCQSLDCGMAGFKLQDGCQLCECNSF